MPKLHRSFNSLALVLLLILWAVVEPPKCGDEAVLAPVPVPTDR